MPESTEPSASERKPLLTPEDKPRMILVVSIMVLGLVIDSTAAYLKLGWQPAAYLTYGALVCYAAFSLIRRDRVIGSLLVFGLIAGFGELPTDAWAVSDLKILVYPLDEPLIWDSPLYMPFSWGVLLPQLGFLLYWITRRWTLGHAFMLAFVIGAVNIPMYENLAAHAGFWFYRDTPMVYSTPYTVILAEALLVTPMPLLVRWVVRWSWPRIAGLAIGFSVWIFVASWIAWQLVGRDGLLTG